MDSAARPRAIAVFIAVAALSVLSACGPHVPAYPDLMGRELFLCCTLRFNSQRVANDANYEYEDGYLLRAGTRIQVVGDDDGVLLVQVPGDSSVYRLGFRFGRRRMEPSQWFTALLLENDPNPAISQWPPEIVAAVDAGRPVVGMSKAQTLSARGYPPFHRTLSVESDDWIFYENGDVVDAVHFVDDRVESVTRGEAPEEEAYSEALVLPPVTLQTQPAAGTPRVPLVHRLGEGPPSSNTPAAADAAARLQELQGLHERGLISDKEYREQRARIVGAI